MSTSMHESLLYIENLSVSFDGFKAVDHLGIQVDPNELRVIIGPNGAGKTTLLDLICGRTKASTGRIEFNGIDLLRLSEHQVVRAGIGRKFQTPSIYENLTVYQNLELSCPVNRGVVGALFRRLPKEFQDRIADIADQIELQNELKTEAGFLSHGQKQWLEIGMLLVQDPKLLMLDEPVAGMSPAERERTAKLLKKIASNRALVVIDHDMEFVEAIADRITVLHQGKVLSEGSMEFVKNDPRVVEVYLGEEDDDDEL